MRSQSHLSPICDLNRTEAQHKVLQLEAETRQKITAYLTQEEMSKEIIHWMVASIKKEYIEELDDE
jgi:hypothetical protein